VTVLVIAEQRGGKLNRATWETVAAAQQAGGPVAIAVLGAGADTAAAELAAADVANVLVVEAAAVAEYTADGYVLALAALVAQEQPALVFLAHTYQARDFAPALAARLGRALVTDVTAVKKTGDRLVYVRPVFQGKLNADVEATGPPPHLVTFQIGAFRADAAARGSSAAPSRTVAVTVDAGAIRQKAEAPFQEARQAVDLSQAERIVSVGRGIKAQEHLKIAEELAKALGAEIAASRPICDAS